MRLFSLILALVLPVSAQEFGSYGDLPLLASPSVSSTPLPPFPSSGLFFRWVASDLTLSNKVSIWTDRIQSNHLTQSNSSLQPMNITNGVQFSGSQSLSGTNLNQFVMPNPFLFYIIYKVDYANTTITIFNDSVSGEETFFAFTGGVNKWTSFPPSVNSGPISTNVITDMFVGLLSGSPKVYTNGVIDIAPAGGINPVFTGIFGTSPFAYEIAEMAYFTNIPATPVTASNLTYYRRAVYGGQ